jgi:putative oxidoreductase
MNAVTQFAPLLGRILVAQLFVYYGFTKIIGFTGTAGYIASKGLSMPEVLAALTIIIEIGGGLMILLGWRARLGAAVLFLWMIPVTFVFHNFWSMEGAAAMANQINFHKNLALMGAMLLIVGFGSGPYSMKKD